MATTKPRVTITFEPRVYAALKAFSEGTGQPMSAFVTQVMNQALPTLEKLARIMQTAKSATPEALRKIGEDLQRLDRAAHRAYGSMETAVDLFADMTEPTGAAAPQSGAARRPAGRKGAKSAACPPISNRGGQNPPRGAETAGSGGSKVVRMRGHRNAR